MTTFFATAPNCVFYLSFDYTFNLPDLRHGENLKLREVIAILIPAKPLHNSDTVSVHFNNFYFTDICDKLRRVLSTLTYIYLNVYEC